MSKTYFERRLNSTAYRNNSTAVRVPLLWLIQNITDSCDFGRMTTYDQWTEMMLTETSDTGFGHLVDSIMRRGFLRSGAIGFRDGMITEGHHRLVASILLGLDYVWVTRRGRSVYKRDSAWDTLVCAHGNTNDPFALPIEV